MSRKTAAEMGQSRLVLARSFPFPQDSAARGAGLAGLAPVAFGGFDHVPHVPPVDRIHSCHCRPYIPTHSFEPPLCIFRISRQGVTCGGFIEVDNLRPTCPPRRH